MDSVIGSKVEKCLLTIHFVDTSFMLAFLRDANTSCKLLSRQHLFIATKTGVDSPITKNRARVDLSLACSYISIIRRIEVKIKLHLGYKNRFSFTNKGKSCVSFTNIYSHLQRLILGVQKYISFYY